MANSIKEAPTERRTLEELLRELNSLIQQRESVQARISKVEAAIQALTELLDDPVERKDWELYLAIVTKPTGLTDVIKYILRAGERLTASEVRDRLLESDFPVSNYSNPLAVVHTTLGRLCDQGLIKKHDDGYEWAEPRERSVAAHLASLNSALKRGERLKLPRS